VILRFVDRPSTPVGKGATEGRNTGKRRTKGIVRRPTVSDFELEMFWKHAIQHSNYHILGSRLESERAPHDAIYPLTAHHYPVNIFG
jgi:hypothetical protein